MPRKPKPPKKPYPDFPLFPHASGQWAKKICGRMHYFGTDAGAALKKYTAERDDLHAGRTPRLHPDGLTVRDLANRFLSAKKALVQSGELSPRTWSDYYGSCEYLVKKLGKNRQGSARRCGGLFFFRGSRRQTRQDPLQNSLAFLAFESRTPRHRFRPEVVLAEERGEIVEAGVHGRRVSRRRPVRAAACRAGSPRFRRGRGGCGRLRKGASSRSGSL